MEKRKILVGARSSEMVYVLWFHAMVFGVRFHAMAQWVSQCSQWFLALVSRDGAMGFTQWRSGFRNARNDFWGKFSRNGAMGFAMHAMIFGLVSCDGAMGFARLVMVFFLGFHVMAQ